MDAIKAIIGSHRNQIWTLTVYTKVGAIVRGTGTTFSEALGRALGKIATC